MLWTPREISKWFRNYGWEALTPDELSLTNKFEIRILGTLELILDELRKVEDKDPLDVHRDWLNNWRIRIDKAIKMHERQVARVTKIVGEHGLRINDFGVDTIECLERLYKRDQEEFYRRFKDIRERTERLKSVLSLDDLENLEGIGKKTAAKIREFNAGGNNGDT